MNLKFKKYMSVIMLVIFIIVGLCIRYKFIYFKSGDYVVFLSKWYDYIKNNGAKEFLSNGVSNYAPLYTYILILVASLPIKKIIAIKLISIIFDFILAIVVLKIVKLKYQSQFIQYAAFATTLLMPTVFLNSSCWGQCDAIYTSFTLLSVYFVMKKQSNLALIMYSIAFSLKLQAVFIAPLFLILYYKKEFKFKQFFYIPFIYIISIIPSLIAGRSFIDLLKIYFYQGGGIEFPKITAPSLVQLVPSPLVHNNYLITIIIFVVLAIVCTLVFCTVIIKRSDELSKDLMVKVALSIVLLVPFLLPRMHERYYFLAEAISIIYAFYFPKLFFVVILIQISTFMTYSSYLFYGQMDLQVLTVLILFVIFIVIDSLKENLFKNNSKEISNIINK